jgi:hypothetical protein
MRKCLGVILVCVAFLSAFGQTPSSKYQPGTIMAVTAHQNPGQSDSDVTQYNVSVKVGNTTYMVLFTPPNGSTTVKYAVGDELLVLVGNNTLTFNTATSGKTAVPILSRETLPAQSLDSTNAPGQYFSLNLQHLSETLALTDNQQAEIKPILEQEAGDVREIYVNPVLSRKDKLARCEKIARASDQKIKPLLSTTQVHKFQDVRNEQKQELKGMITDQKSEQN